MSNTESIQHTLEVMIAQIDELELATAQKKKAANEICRLLDQEPTYPNVDDVTSAGAPTLPDEYYGLQVPDVIRTILEKRKRANKGAATVAEIHQSMTQGGFQFKTDNEVYARRGVYSVLADAQFHKLPDGRYGLASWYPAAKTRSDESEQKRKNGTKKKKGGTKKRSGSKQSSKTRSLKPNKAASGDAKGGATASILRYIEANPRLEASQVVDAISPNIRTRAGDPQKLLHAIIRQMIWKGRLKRVGEDGRQLEIANEK